MELNYLKLYFSLTLAGLTIWGVDEAVDLYKIKESWKHKNWILPFNDEIKGL